MSEARKRASFVRIGAIVINPDGEEAGGGVQGTTRGAGQPQNDTTVAFDRPAGFMIPEGPDFGPEAFLAKRQLPVKINCDGAKKIAAVSVREHGTKKYRIMLSIYFYHSRKHPDCFEHLGSSTKTQRRDDGGAKIIRERDGT